MCQLPTTSTHYPEFNERLELTNSTSSAMFILKLVKYMISLMIKAHNIILQEGLE